MDKNQIKKMIEERCANFIMCTNSNCKSYWEDMCTKNVQNEIVHLNGRGQCEDFEYGRSKWYEEDEHK